MHCLHVNAHVSLHLDVADILRTLGHTIDQVCLSEHMWVIGGKPDQHPGFPANMADFDQYACDQCKARFDVKPYDVVIVDHPAAFAAMFQDMPVPVVLNVTTRWDNLVAVNNDRRAWLGRALCDMAKSGQMTVLANNRGDVAHVKETLGLEARHIPSLCRYTRTHWTGKHRNWLMTTRSHPPLPRPYKWEDLADYRGIMHIPYNCSQMSVFEQYAACIPLMVPTREMLFDMTIDNRYDAMSEVTFRRVYGMAPGDGLDNYINPEAIRRWIGLSDWYDQVWMPYVIEADSYPTYGFEDVSRRMATFNVGRTELILQQWRDALLV